MKNRRSLNALLSILVIVLGFVAFFKNQLIPGGVLVVFGFGFLYMVLSNEYYEQNPHLSRERLLKKLTLSEAYDIVLENLDDLTEEEKENLYRALLFEEVKEEKNTSESF